MSDSIHISGPRSIFKDDEASLKKGVHRLKLGGTTSGVVLDVSKKGITLNGYYQSFDSETFFACVREPVEILWEELDKIRIEVNKRKKRTKKKTLEPSKVDKPTKKYLDKLPVVTINQKKYYLDAELRQRRPISDPESVYNY